IRDFHVTGVQTCALPISRWAGADSRLFLREAARLAREAGWFVVNVDATVHAQAPKIAPHAPAMVACIASDLGIEASAVNVKAKRSEERRVGQERGPTRPA